MTIESISFILMGFNPLYVNILKGFHCSLINGFGKGGISLFRNRCLE